MTITGGTERAAAALGARLRGLRRRAGLSQERLAELARVSTHTVSNLERGVYDAPRLDTLSLVSDALGLAGTERDALFAILDRDDPVSPGDRLTDSPVAEPALPRAERALLGRDAALAALLDRLADPAVRVVTLFGPGGVGKTRLALEAAGRIAASGRPVAWAPLEALGSPEEVLPAIARAVGAAGAAQADPVARIAEAVAGRDLLLVADNWEHVIEAAPDLARALAAAPSLRVLATSREMLRIGGEERFPVAPLPVPADGDDETRVAANPAVALFVERAALDGVAGPALADVRRVVTALDGLPLAIELAAAQAESLSVDALARLLDRFGIEALDTGRRDVHARLRSMERAVRWSYDLLDDRARRLLRSLSVFRGGADLALLEELCERLGEPELVRGLPALVRASLVGDRPGDDGRARIQVLSPIRLFAEAELAGAGEAEAVRLAHRRVMRDAARREFARIVGPEAIAGLAAMDRERDNLTAALDHAIRAGDAADAMALAARMAAWWEVRGEVAEGVLWLERAFALPGADARPEDLSWAGRIAIMLNVFRGRTDHWLPLAERLLQVATEAGDGRGLAIALTWLGDHAWYVGGDLAAARAHHERAVAAAEPLGDSIELAQALDRLGDVLTELGDPAAALPLLNRGIAVRRRLGNELNLAAPLLFQAGALAALGREEEARLGFLAAALQAQRMGFRVQVAQALVRLAASTAAGAGPDRLADAVRLLGAADGMLARHRVALDATLAPFRDAVLAAGAAALGEEARARLLAEGRAMSAAEALELAGA